MSDQDHSRKTPSVAELMRKRVAEEAAREVKRSAQQGALRVVERWNAERSVLWSPTIHYRNALVGRLLSRLPDKPGNRYPRGRPPSARIDWKLGARPALFMVPGDAPMPVLTGLHAVPPAARWRKSTPVESLHGRPLSPEDLEMIRRQIEEGAEGMAAVDNEIRGIVARNWPHLLAKLPPEED